MMISYYYYKMPLFVCLSVLAMRHTGDTVFLWPHSKQPWNGRLSQITQTKYFVVRMSEEQETDQIISESRCLPFVQTASPLLSVRTNRAERQGRMLESTRRYAQFGISCNLLPAVITDQNTGLIEVCSFSGTTQAFMSLIVVFIMLNINR